MKLHYMLAGVVAATALWSCGGSKGDADTIHTMEIERYFDEPAIDNITHKIKIKEKFTPEFTDSTMYNAPRLCAVADGRAYMRPHGQLPETFTRYGAGPEEYQYSYETYFTPADGLWTVHDSNVGRYNIMQYDNAGRLVRKTVNDSINVIAPTPGGGWLAFNPSYSMEGGFHKIAEKIIREYDSDWKLLAETQLHDKRMMMRGGGFMDIIMNCMGNNYVNDRDTIWRYDCDTHRLAPAIAMHIGKYGYDWSTVNTMEERDRVEETHLTPLYPIFNNRYAFLSYYKPGEEINRYDIYDLRDGSLVYRMERPKNEDVMRRMGLPLEIDGMTVMGWPILYQDSEDFYVMIPAENIAEATGNDEVNPVILKFSIDD